MADKYFPMVDAYPQIKAALEKLSNTKVTERWPRSKPDGSLIVVSEITNANTSIPAVDQLAYQVDVWAEDEDTVRRLWAGVDEVFFNIGFRRTMAGALDCAEGFRRVFRYGRKVDKRTMRLID